MPRPVNALIVDDEPHVVVLFRALLKELGITTVWDAAQASEALEQVEAHKPEVVLLDINLPLVDGLQILAQMKAKNPGMPVVIVTAQSTLKTLSRARSLGADAYVLKYEARSEVLKQLSQAFDEIAAKQGGDGAEQGAGQPAKA
jgi:DNA-binding NarL/FixJ family response regulator